jgi:glycogen debranching enzyme
LQIEHVDQHYIQVTGASLSDEPTRVLKQGDTFAIFDRHGDAGAGNRPEQGIFHGGTRFLSNLLLRVEEARPLVLSSAVRSDNVLLSIDLTNPDISRRGHVAIERGTLHFYRTKFLWQAVCYERLHVRNYGQELVEVTLGLRADADFADIFEVRGHRRPRRGDMHFGRRSDGMAIVYEGLDEVIRSMRLRCTPAPEWISGHEMFFRLRLPPKEETEFVFTVSCEVEENAPVPLQFEPALECATGAMREKAGKASLSSTSQTFNNWWDRSDTDLDLMITNTPQGPYPYAGVPWFSTPFGRDGIITALETLWIHPELAKGVLAFLAKTQASAVIPEQDAEPGKILHESRIGEMAALREVPFGRYYGSIDSTPLFLMLAGEYFRRTADLEFLQTIWSNVERALEWIDNYGDMDGDGFVEYYRRSSTGLVQQGWKDSHDSIFHAGGALVEGPVALCEVQGYVYAAKLGVADVALALGRRNQADLLREQAERLRQRFEEAFWCESLSTYALALDGKKHRCEVVTSNAGHCLFTRIASPERAARLVDKLLSEECFSGWGIRTLGTSEVRYNPMSYHNGSVWPHDNALIARGFSYYDMPASAAMVLRALMDAAAMLDLNRMPELFCGFVRRKGKAPTLYPVACAPQAWSAAAVHLLIQACLGLTIDAVKNCARFSHPFLPHPIHSLRIRGLQVGQTTAELVVHRKNGSVEIETERQEGPLSLLVT